MNFIVCPFCGVGSDGAHDSQEACIQALQAEIERTRAVLTRVSEPIQAPSPTPDYEEDGQQA